MRRNGSPAERNSAGGPAESEADQTAVRLRRPSWRDPRLLLGLLITAVSVAGVVALVSAQDRTIPVYAADRALSVGDPLTDQDLRVVHIRYQDGASHYLSAEEGLPEDVEVVTFIGEGELLPRRAVASADASGRQAVTVQVDHPLAGAVKPGRLVDVWATSAAVLDEESPEVRRAAERAEVIDIREDTSAFGAAHAVTVEMLVEPAEIPDLLATMGSGAALSVLPAGAELPSSEPTQDAAPSAAP